MATALHTTSRCGFCHADRTPTCFPPAPVLLCGEGGAADHQAPAMFVVEYRIDETGRRDFDNGDVHTELLYVCGHNACIGSAENHATDAGHLVETRALTAQDIADATGYELVSA